MVTISAPIGIRGGKSLTLMFLVRYALELASRVPPPLLRQVADYSAAVLFSSDTLTFNKNDQMYWASTLCYPGDYAGNNAMTMARVSCVYESGYVKAVAHGLSPLNVVSNTPTPPPST